MLNLRFLLEYLRRPGSDEGATAVEYALLVGIIAIALSAAAILLSNEIKSVFNSVIAVM